VGSNPTRTAYAWVVYSLRTVACVLRAGQYKKTSGQVRGSFVRHPVRTPRTSNSVSSLKCSTALEAEHCRTSVSAPVPAPARAVCGGPGEKQVGSVSLPAAPLIEPPALLPRSLRASSTRRCCSAILR
jgi:hypothetical protein